jgi:hypothetical protein
VTANRSESIEELAAQKKPGVPSALERPRVDLIQGDATASDLGFLESLVASPRQEIRRQPLDQSEALGSP